MQRIGFVILPDFQMLYFAALSVFEFANISAGKQLYSIELLSEHGGMMRSSLGAMIETTPFGDPNFDTLLVGGGTASVTASPAVVDFVQRGHCASRRIASICTGAFVLGQAGILDGKRVTTHWIAARELKERFPLVRIEPDRIFIIDGSIWTSAASLGAGGPPTRLLEVVRPDEHHFFKLTREGVDEVFAQDLTATERAMIFATQNPLAGAALGGEVTAPAWKGKPSWYLLASEDHTIHPELQKKMAERIEATTITVAASHVAMLSQPDAVAKLVVQAAG